MRPMIRAATLAILAMAAGCTSNGGDSSGAKPTSGLVGDWRLATLTDRGTPVPLNTRGPVTIRFDGNGEASWFDGANTTSASYAVADDRVAFADSASTLVGSVPGSPAYAIGLAFADLERRPRVSVVGDALTLRTKRYEFGFARG